MSPISAPDHYIGAWCLSPPTAPCVGRCQVVSTQGAPTIAPDQSQQHNNWVLSCEFWDSPRQLPTDWRKCAAGQCTSIWSGDTPNPAARNCYHPRGTNCNKNQTKDKVQGLHRYILYSYFFSSCSTMAATNFTAHTRSVTPL